LLGAADAIILEDSLLRVAVLPQSGGKVWSIHDKVRDKQIIFNNPAHQPMTVGSRGAWTSGGIEWNYRCVLPFVPVSLGALFAI
jgi:hypothetical protein